MKALNASKSLFLAYMEKELPRESPQNLYEPVRYIMGLGGKRIRPLLALWACVAGGRPEEAAVAVALLLPWNMVDR